LRKKFMAHEPEKPESSAPKQHRPAIQPPVYDALRGLAAAYLQQERRDHTLQPTALVHEAYLKLAVGSSDWRSQTHFQAIASNAMRQILVDHARARNRLKRGGDRLRVTLTPNSASTPESEIDLIALDDALNGLAEFDERKARVVELRFFGGLTCAEVALEIGVSPKTVEADWYFARAWLRDMLGEDAT
jgi:RNA polymerase sigma-70 factor (ECF subfamily)